MRDASNSGPIPKRSDQRRRMNKDAVAIDSAPGAEFVEVPAANDEWSKPAKRWYESLAESGQARWFEPSDWAQAWILTEMLDRVMTSSKPSAMMFNAWLQGAGELLTTEGTRRRMRMELTRGEKSDQDKDSAVADLDAFRMRLAPTSSEKVEAKREAAGLLDS